MHDLHGHVLSDCHHCVIMLLDRLQTAMQCNAIECTLEKSKVHRGKGSVTQFCFASSLIFDGMLFSLRPAPMPGAAELSRLTTSVRTPPQPPCSWGLFLEAPCQAWPQQAPPLSTCVSRLTRFPTTCPCHLAGRWQRPALARDTSSSKCSCDKCHGPFVNFNSFCSQISGNLFKLIFIALIDVL